MKRMLIALPILLISLLLIAVIAPSFMDWNSYKPEIQKQMQERYGLNVVMDGDIKLSVLPYPRVMVSGVKLSNGSDAPAFLAFERFDVNTAILPLLSGKLKLNSVSLIKPSLDIKDVGQGRYNFASPQIEALMNPAAKNQGDVGGSQGSAAPSQSMDISVNRLFIEDGVFNYTDKQNTQTKVSGINIDLSADQLDGPFEARGSLALNDKVIRFDVTTGQIDANSKQISIKSTADIQPEQVNIGFAGALSWADGFTALGEVKLDVVDMAALARLYGTQMDTNEALSASGMLNYAQNEFELKDLVLSLGQDKVSGSIRVKQSPFNVDASLKTAGDVHLERIFPDLREFGVMNFDITAQSDGKKASLSKSSLNIAGIPLQLSADYVPAVADGRAKIKLGIDAPQIDLRKFPALDKNISKPEAGAASTDLKSPQKKTENNVFAALILPFDLDFDFNIKGMTSTAYSLSDASGTVKVDRDSATLSKLNIANMFGASVSASAKITQLGAANNIDVSVDVDTKDIKALFESLDMDASTLPENIKAAKLEANYKGTQKSGVLALNVGALGGKVKVQGNIDSILNVPKISAADVHVTHPNMQQAIANLSGGAFDDPNFTKALDFKAHVIQDGKKYNVKNIVADLSGAALKGDVLFDASNPKPYISGDLSFGDLTLQSSIEKTSGASTKQSGQSAPQTPKSASAGKWSTQEFDTASLNAANFDLTIKAKSITYGPWPMIEPHLKASLQNGTLSVSELNAGLFDGKIALSGSIASVEQQRQPIHAQGEFDFSGVSLDKLARALTGNDFVKISGKVNGKTSIKTSGLSPAAFIYDLSGNGVMNGSDLVLEGVDVVRFAKALSDDSKPGDTVLGMWKGSTKGGETRFDTLDGAYTISEGIVNIQKMDLDGSRAAIQTTGNVNLPAWTIATKHKIIVKPVGDAPQDVPPFEMSFNGSLDNPAQTFGQGLLNDYLSRKVQRKLNKLLSDKIGVPANDADAQDAGEQKPKSSNDAAQEAIKGVLDGFLR